MWLIKQLIKAWNIYNNNNNKEQNKYIHTLNKLNDNIKKKGFFTQIRQKKKTCIKHNL